jgi:hypothetical protein
VNYRKLFSLTVLLIGAAAMTVSAQEKKTETAYSRAAVLVWSSLRRVDGDFHDLGI